MLLALTSMTNGDRRMFTKEQLIATFQRVATEVAERDFPSLKGETVISDLGIDSLGMLEIVGAMEREFKIQIPDDQLVGLRTIDDLVGLMERVGCRRKARALREGTGVTEPNPGRAEGRNGVDD